MRYEWMLARRYLRSRRGERFVSFIGWTSALGIALGVATLIVVLSVMHGAAVEIRDKILGFSAHVDVQGPGEVLYGWRGWLDRIVQVPGVVRASPYLQAQALVAADEAARGAILKGVDPAREPMLAARIARGRFLREDDEFVVVIGDALARRLGVDVGDSLRIITPKAGVGPAGLVPRARAFRIVGIFDSGFYEYDVGLVLAPLGAVQRLLRTGDAVSGIEVFVRDRDAAPRLARRVEKALPFGAWVQDWTRRHRVFFKALRTERVAMGVILFMIVLVACFNMVSSLVMVVMERRREIAVLKTIGATNAEIGRIFVFMAVMLAGAGVLAGGVLGLLLAWKLEPLLQWLERLFGVTFMSGEVYYIDHVPSVIDPVVVSVVIVVSFALGVASAVYPARRAARVPPAEALRVE